MESIKFQYPVQSKTNCITDGKGMPLNELIETTQTVDLASRVLPVIKPEDFTGGTIAEKVIAANDFIINAGGGYELYLGDTSTYLLTKAIVLPNNTRVRIHGCTVQMTDNTVDNIFRSGNIILDSDNPRGFALNKDNMESAENLEIIGESGASLLMCDNASSSNYGVTKTGWHGHTIMFAGVSNFSISGFTVNKNIAWGICLSGCSYGNVHDIVFNTTRENGDGIDVEFGSHDIDIYNISGVTADDTVAISNSGPSRLEMRPQEVTRPTCPFSYDYRRFGNETYNIRVYNVNAQSTDHIVIFICGDYGIHDCSVAQVSDKDANNASNVGSASIVMVYGGQYDGGYTQGMIHNCSVNDVKGYACSQAAIHLSEGVIEHGRINKVYVTSGGTVLKDQSGVNIADYDFTVTNTGTLT